MVNVPFVSEEFQRAFRNTFQGQVNSGRDLHVSDIVIPVVDFTPTTSGTSLPESLRYCVNRNTTSFRGGSTISATSIGVSDGFYRIQAGLSAHEGQSNVNMLLNGDSDVIIEQLYMTGSSTSKGKTGNREFIVYQKVGDTNKKRDKEVTGEGKDGV